MPPVNTSASPPDVDNEATAELPVLDVAAYESTLNEPLSHTDTWVIPVDAASPIVASADRAESIPTLRAAEPAAYDSDHSGTHEMPAMPKFTKHVKPAATAPAASSPAPAAIPATYTLPPSPPLIEELRNALAAAERRIEELNERARIADAERGVAIARVNAENAQLREQLGLHLESLQTAHERLGLQGADEPELQNELFARADRIAALESQIAAQTGVLDEKIALLSALQQRCGILDVDSMNLRGAVARRDSQLAMLEADLVARQQREDALKARLTEALASVEPHVPQLRADLAAREAEIRRLDAELKEALALVDDKNEDLQVAEESIRRFEIEVRDKTGKLEEASVTVEEWRAVIAESQRSILERDGRIRDLEGDLDRRRAAAVDSAAQTGEEVTLEGPARVLIRTSGNTDFVHVLGRRTRIGRGSDNELVLDTKHISRYHAVLLAGPVHTSIEDLNSTNGVFVNSKRISRQVLKDGDKVTIGRTQFRYTVRD